MKKLVIDFDDTVVESIFLHRVNQFLGTNHTFENFKNYYIDDIIPLEKRNEFFDHFCDTNPYFEVKILDGAKETIKLLSEKYDIYICSGCVINNMPQKSAKLFSFKFDYLIKTFPFLDPNRFIFTNSKEILMGDVIIDDYLHNLKGNFSQKFLFTSYHNKHFSNETLLKQNVVRVNSWEEIKNFLV